KCREGAGIDGHVHGFVEGFVGGDGGAGGDGNIERSEGSAGALGEEDGAVVEVEIFVFRVGMSGEKSGEGAEIQIFFGDDAVVDHGQAGGGVFVGVVAGVADFACSSGVRAAVGGCLV